MAARNRMCQLANSHAGGAELASIYPFPTGATYAKLEFVDDAGTITERLIIYYAGAPSTNFTEAPVGSIFVNTTAGSVTAYLKVDTADTWTVFGSLA